jgi:hypothetical protein
LLQEGINVCFLSAAVLLLALDQRILVDPQNVSHAKQKQSGVYRVELLLQKILPRAYVVAVANRRWLSGQEPHFFL